MDERILKVLKAVARGELATHEDYEDDCMFCDAEKMHTDITELKDVVHEPDCPVTLARRVLRDLGTPPYIYKVEFEYCLYVDKAGERWQVRSHYVIACDELDAISAVDRTRTRNEHATVVRVLPLKGEK